MSRRWIFVLLPLLLPGAACDVFYDEGARFANQIADFAARFRTSANSTAVFDYTSLYGANQTATYEIGRIRWCPDRPCDGQGAATVIVERGKSGTGYRIAAEASAPQPLRIEKRGSAVHVYMRKENGEVQIVALR